MTKKNIGQVFSFTFQYIDCIENYTGYIIDCNDDWILLKYNPVNYLIDGYLILQRKYIIEFQRNSKEKFIQKIIDLKGQKPVAKEIIPLTDLKTILNYLTAKYGLFQFSMKTNKSCWLGKVKNIIGSDYEMMVA